MYCPFNAHPQRDGKQASQYYKEATVVHHVCLINVFNQCHYNVIKVDFSHKCMGLKPTLKPHSIHQYYPTTDMTDTEVYTYMIIMVATQVKQFT